MPWRREIVLAAASRTGRLLILKEGAAEIIKGDVEIAKVTTPGAVLGELSVLLDKPHTADVRALETSQFMSPSQPACWAMTLLRPFTSASPWHDASTAPMRPSSS
jgi:hypothetical protein